MSRSSEQITFHDLIRGIEHRSSCDLMKDIMDDGGEYHDMVIVHWKAYAFLSSLGMEIVEIAGHSLDQAIFMGGRIDIEC